jgi:hypothetical protein
MTADPQRPSPPPFLAFAVACAGLALVAGVTLAFQFAPPAVRVWNLSVVGALALFAAARLGIGYGIAFTAVAIALKDICLYFTADWWEPYPLSWLYFAGYALAGWWFLRRRADSGRVATTALGVSLGFFVVSNFVSWLEQALPYGYSLDGLRDCYAAAVPFYRGTLMGDVLFSAALFGAYALLVPAPRPLPQEALDSEVLS